MKGILWSHFAGLAPTALRDETEARMKDAGALNGKRPKLDPECLRTAAECFAEALVRGYSETAVGEAPLNLLKRSKSKAAKRQSMAAP